jgi:hypothetical protein
MNIPELNCIKSFSGFPSDTPPKMTTNLPIDSAECLVRAEGLSPVSLGFAQLRVSFLNIQTKNLLVFRTINSSDTPESSSPPKNTIFSSTTALEWNFLALGKVPNAVR